MPMPTSSICINTVPERAIENSINNGHMYSKTVNIYLRLIYEENELENLFPPFYLATNTS
jgi:hypothetical protein